MVSIALVALLLWIAVASNGGSARAQTGGGGASDAETAPTTVLVIPLQDVIDTATAAIVTRGLREAAELGVQRVVLEIDTPASVVDASRALDTVLSRIKNQPVATVAYVKGNAFGGGALVALATRELWMAPRAAIGAAAPTELSAARVQELNPQGRIAQQIDAVRDDLQALLRARGDGAGEDAERLVGAMADARMRLFEVVYVGEDGRQKRSVLTDDELALLDREGREVLLRQELSTRPLTLQAEEAQRYGVSRGTIASLEELLYEEAGARPENIRRLDPTWSEDAAGWLGALQPVLFVLGFLLLIVELKTAGFAVPGALGILMLGFALFGSYLSGLADITEFLLFALGLIGLGLEIFVAPGTIVFGGLGLLCIGSSLVLAQQSFLIPENAAQYAIFQGNLINLLLLVVFVVAGAIVISYLLPNTPILNRAFLKPRQTRPGEAYATAGGSGPDPRIGKRGKTATPLRPSGIVDLDGERFDATSEGGFVDAGQRVFVTGMRGAALVVVPEDVVEGGGGRPVASGGESGGESGAVSVGFLVFLLLLGVVFVVLEVFFVSLGALSILAAVSMITAIFLAFTQYGEGVGFAFLITAAVAGPAAFFGALRILPYTPFGNALLLRAPERARTSAQAEARGIHELVDATGEAISDLRPSGFARFAGRRVDVVSRGELIPAGTPVRVLRVDGNRVVVRADATATEAS
jgi:membrane-bound serine protease (ClpP class)